MIFLLLTSALDTQSSSHASGTFPLGPMIKQARTTIVSGLEEVQDETWWQTKPTY